MNMEFVSKCLNGELRVGDQVINTPMDDYPIMRGRVIEIHPAGSEEALNETDNDGDCIHVEFLTDELSEERIAEIEAVFSRLYDCKKTFNEIFLDDVIETQDMLLNINSISDRQKSMIDDSEESARLAAFEILCEYTSKAQAADAQISMSVNNGGQQLLNQQTPDGNIAFTRLFPDGKGGMAVESEAGISAGDMVMLLNHYTNCKEKDLPLVIEDYGFLDRCETALDEYWGELEDSLGCVRLQDEIVSIQNKMNEVRRLTSMIPIFKKYVRFMLVTVTEREIATEPFNTYEQAFAKMEEELDETMLDGRDNNEDEYGIYMNSAWSNANKNAKCDWKIVKI